MWYGFTTTGQRGKLYEKIFFTFDFRILPYWGQIGARVISSPYISIKRILNAVGVDTFIPIETVSKMVNHVGLYGSKAAEGC